MYTSVILCFSFIIIIIIIIIKPYAILLKAMKIGKKLGQVACNSPKIFIANIFTIQYSVFTKISTVAMKANLATFNHVPGISG